MKHASKLMAILLVLPIALGLTSCAEVDNSIDRNPLADQVKGMWWTQYDADGTTLHGDDYTRIINSLLLNDDGTGYACTMYFDNESGAAVFMLGGYTLQGGIKFNYTTTADGRIHLQFNADDPLNQEYAKVVQSWTITYADRHINCTDGTDSHQLDLATDDQSAWLQSLFHHYAGGASAVDYNINDYRIKLGSDVCDPITADNWREQGSIFLYVGGAGSDQGIHDTNGRTGYTQVNLPWARSTVQSNLPNGFCDALTPENGWLWVYNLCGNRSTENGNFFALYNKFTGLLRFFFYMPSQFSSGNDHVWQVSMPDNLALHGYWHYGLPIDRTITNKALLGQTEQGTYMDYVTPWVDYKSNDGLIVPAGGWWAFDVDLSTYRPGTSLADNDNIRLQMRSWTVEHVSLYSTMAAQIDGTMKANMKLDQVTQKSTSAASGIMMGLKAVTQAGSMVSSFYEGDWIKGLGSLGDLIGTGAKIAGVDDETKSGYEGTMDGTISLGLHGEMNTDGTISQSVPTTGFYPVTLQLSDFDLDEAPSLGQGTWNLKTAPVVYRSKNYNRRPINYMTNDYVNPYFFDPNSIELELNPDVFPEDQIEWIEVDALCGGRKVMQPKNDNLRQAFGLTLHTNYKDRSEGSKLSDESHGALLDFLYATDDKQGMKELEEIYRADGKSYSLGYKGEGDEWHYRQIEGRGKDGFALEPQYTTYDNDKIGSSLPFLEVNVKVLVKMKDRKAPIVLSRNYLPEIKDYDVAEMLAARTKTKPYASKMQGHTALYDYQMKRIKDICEMLSLEYPYTSDDEMRLIPTSGRDNYNALFDGNTSNYWLCDWNRYVEFYSTQPITPKRYYLTTAGSDARYNPKNWVLKAKASQSDSWTTIATVTNDNKLPGGKIERVGFDLDITNKQWKYFRFEVSAVQEFSILKLAGFELDY